MKHLIFATHALSLERNHADALRKWAPVFEPQTAQDSWYIWPEKFHPTDGRVALVLPDEYVGEPGDQFVAELPSDWNQVEVLP